MFMNPLRSNLFGSGGDESFRAPGGFEFSGSGATGTDNVLTQTEGLISNVIGLLTTLAAVFFLINFFLGAFNWITAGGDQSKIQQARDKMVNGVIGLVVIVAAYGIVGIIGSVVGIDILNIGDTIRGTGGGTNLLPF
jgi:hypothetical protein